MSKKRTGLLIAVGAALGAAAAGISYYLKYKSFNKEIDSDFHDYEEDEIKEETDDEPVVTCSDASRTYISLDSNKTKSSEPVVSCEESAPAESVVVAEPTAAVEGPTAATVEEDTEGAN